jgi:chemotaxis protein CheC
LKHFGRRGHKVNKNRKFSEAELDFLKETMNIGAGNTATALSQMLKCTVDISIPEVKILPLAEVHSILAEPSFPVVSVRMGMVGDVKGDLFFIVPNKQKMRLINLVRKASPGYSHLRKAEQESAKRDPKKPGPGILNRELTDLDRSILTEIGNIVAGVYLTAIHDFCRLNIYHSVPCLICDMIQAALDESLVNLSWQLQTTFLIENIFVVENDHIRTFLLIIPSKESIDTLVDSIEQAKMVNV